MDEPFEIEAEEPDHVYAPGEYAYLMNPLNLWDGPSVPAGTRVKVLAVKQNERGDYTVTIKAPRVKGGIDVSDWDLNPDE